MRINKLNFTFLNGLLFVGGRGGGGRGGGGNQELHSYTTILMTITKSSSIYLRKMIEKSVLKSGDLSQILISLFR